MLHAYPSDLAAFVADVFPGYGVEMLGHLFSVAYQASLLREEERAVTFRLLLADPEEMPAEAGPPLGLHRLRFDAVRPFDEEELRRLAPAAKLQRALERSGITRRHAARACARISSRCATNSALLRPQRSKSNAESSVLPSPVASTTSPRLSPLARDAASFSSASH